MTEVEYEPDVSAETLPSYLPGAKILIVRGTRVSANSIDAAEELELIVRAGAGTENIDLQAASARGLRDELP